MAGSEASSLSGKAGGVLSFGELLLRMCPDTDGAWLDEHKLPFYVGGAEANVAGALALWGIPSSYISAIPENAVSEQVLDHLNKAGIDTSRVLLEGKRMGIYYLHKGRDLKNAAVIYDREDSSFATLKPGTIDWKSIFKGISWFHFSAICPAIGRNIVAVCDEALQYASQNGISISVDLNYRAKLWKYGAEPAEIMPSLLNYCNLVMGNVWAAEKMLGIPVGEELQQNSKELYLAQSEKTSAEIMKHYPRCEAVANTFRFDHGSEGINYYTTLYKDGRLYTSAEYTAEKITDKVGSGDCFMAGLIYGFYKGHAPEDILAFATAAAYTKLFVNGDATNISAEAILKSIKA